MKFFALVAAALILTFAGIARADDFGARFGETAPAALQDDSSPQNIEPAAGGETPDTEEAAQAKAASTQEQPAPVQPGATTTPAPATAAPAATPAEAKKLLP